MGYHNVAAVMACWSAQLESKPMLLLMHMALVSLDPPGRNGTAPCHYWGDVGTQALALGLTNKATSRMLRKLRASLVSAGAIVLVAPGNRARSPVWLVVTEPPREPAQLPWLDGTY